MEHRPPSVNISKLIGPKRLKRDTHQPEMRFAAMYFVIILNIWPLFITYKLDPLNYLKKKSRSNKFAKLSFSAPRKSVLSPKGVTAIQPWLIA